MLMAVGFTIDCPKASAFTQENNRVSSDYFLIENNRFLYNNQRDYVVIFGQSYPSTDYPTLSTDYPPKNGGCPQYIASPLKMWTLRVVEFRQGLFFGFA